MKIAIVHYWLIGMRGGEKVVEALCDMFPDADIFTHVVDPAALSPTIASHRICTSFIASLPRSKSMYKTYLPLMPLALERLDLRDYDLVISSESGPAKGILPSPGALHLCYCHSPMRYIWNMYHEYHQNAGFFTKVSMPLLTHYLRVWDESSAARVDSFVANSYNVAARVRKYYRREARVVHPPVETDVFTPVPESDIGDYHLMVGELVRYKRPELAVEAFNRLGKRLIIIGGGEMLDELRKQAGPTVEILGPQPFAQLRHHYARAKALIFPGEEDFGIVPVEAMASGRPVIAYGRGGATETVVDGVTGVLFPEQSVDAIADAVERADGTAFDASLIVTHARRFGRERFVREMQAAIDSAFAEQRRAMNRDSIAEVVSGPEPALGRVGFG